MLGKLSNVHVSDRVLLYHSGLVHRELQSIFGIAALFIDLTVCDA